MKWSWRSADPKCDIKAQRHANFRSVERYMASENNRDHCQDCDTECLDLDMDADSSRSGWLRLGPVDGFDEETYCGPTLTI
ncbi:hypothetical protein N7527_010720 [Penicillium freii]|nr:hypothetical protein N7527_010720 [Penicillium freii]